jgi:hypothetical protein
MDDEIIENIRFDDRLESYESFYDHDWAKKFDALTRGTPLAKQAGSLGANWKAAANTHRMPWLMMEFIKLEI